MQLQFKETPSNFRRPHLREDNGSNDGSRISPIPGPLHFFGLCFFREFAEFPVTVVRDVRGFGVFPFLAPELFEALYPFGIERARIDCRPDRAT